MIAINIENGIKQIAYDENLMNIYIQDDTLVIDTKINGNIIDANFNELDSRLSEIESQLRLRYNGEFQRLKSELEELQGKINNLKLTNNE